MSEPHSHHWLPQFLMRPWTGDDGLVTSFYRPRDRVAWKRMSLKALGSERDLYRLEFKGPLDPMFLEKEFMTKAVDGPAAIVREQLLSHGTDHLNDKQRISFAAFLVLLLVRSPKVLRPLQEKGETSFRSVVYPGIKVADEGNTTSSMGRDAIYEEHFAGYGGDLVFEALIRYAQNSPYLAQLRNLSWSVLNVPSNTSDLVLSDRPILMFGGPEELQCLVLPIAPKKLFVAGIGSAGLSESETSQFIEQVVQLQFARSERFVVTNELPPSRKLLDIAERHMKRNSS